MARPLTSPRGRFTVTDELVTVRGRRLRVQVRRPQAPSGPPLLLINGIGAALDAARPVRRRAARGPRGDPLRPARRRRLTRRGARLPRDDLRTRRRRPRHPARPRPGRRARLLVGRPAGPAARHHPAQAGPQARARRDDHRGARGAPEPAGALPVPPAAVAAGSGGRPGRRRRAVRRDGAHPPGARGRHVGGDRRQPAPQPAWLRPAARRERRLDEPAPAPPDPGADTGDRR